MRLFLTALLLCLFLTTNAFPADIRLSAAASMTDAVGALIAAYRQSVEDVTFLPNFASSGSLARQIALGAPADLFISANPRWMGYLVERGRIEAGSVRTLARNALVFAGRPGPELASLAEVAALRRIAIGSPGSVPAGQYARQALEAAALYDALRPRLVMAKDVRQALMYAERGEVDGAFVYRTDALLAREAVVLLEVPAKFYDEVACPVGLTVAGAARAEVRAFHDFLETDQAAAVLERYGFAVR